MCQQRWRSIYMKMGDSKERVHHAILFLTFQVPLKYLVNLKLISLTTSYIRLSLFVL